MLILAGGRGSRLGGVRKAFLEIGGQPIVRRVVAALEGLAGETLVLADQAVAVEGARVLVDREAHGGVLPALEHGLSAAGGEVCLIVAGDMPFVSSAVFAYQLRLLEDEKVEVVVPRVEGVLQPMHAVVRRQAALEALRSGVAAGETRFFRVLESLRTREVTEAELRTLDPDLQSLFNVNTPEDLAAARSAIR